jgi:hypothetical protein
VFALYLDEDSGDLDVVAGLRRAGVDVVRSADVGMGGATDEEHLARAASLGRALVSANVRDFAKLHGEWARNGRPHAGLVLVTQQRYSKGELVRRLLALESARTASEMRNAVEFLARWGS